MKQLNLGVWVLNTVTQCAPIEVLQLRAWSRWDPSRDQGTWPLFLRTQASVGPVAGPVFAREVDCIWLQYL